MPAWRSRWLWALLLLAAALFVGIGVLLAPLEPGAMALQFARDAQACTSVVRAWTPQEASLYRQGLAIDFALIASYTTLGLAVGRSAGFGPRTRACLYALVLLAAACDTGENIAHLQLLRGAGECGRALHAAALGLTALKWAVLAGYVVVAAVAAWLRPRV